MEQDRTRLGKRARWVGSVFERRGDLMAIGSGVIGLAVIVAVILFGLHERQTSFRSVSSAESARDVSYR